MNDFPKIEYSMTPQCDMCKADGAECYPPNNKNGYTGLCKDCFHIFYEENTELFESNKKIIEFKKDDKFWSIDLDMECGTVIHVDNNGYGIMNHPNLERKIRVTAKTKEECVNDMISQLKKLRDFTNE